MKAPFALLLTLCVSMMPAVRSSACCAVSGDDRHVINADQTVIMIWNPESKTQHFIRQASFKSDAGDVGFIVPSPSRPELAESGDAAFSRFAEITAPVSYGSGFEFPLGCSASAPAIRAAEVEVLERKRVAGFDAVVLRSGSSEALTRWLTGNAYPYSPAVKAWAEPYVARGWPFTALKVAPQDPGGSLIATKTIEASALRISFRTETPLFPYREPASSQAVKELGATSRLLRIYFIADEAYTGSFDSGERWDGRVVWSGDITDERQRLSDLLDLPDAGPQRWWLTKFEDRWPYVPAPGDLVFSAGEEQESMAANRRYGGFDLTLCIVIFLLMARSLQRFLARGGIAALSRNCLFPIILACAVILRAPTLSAATEKPNVLFLICDDLNCDLGAYGHPQVQSPNIDKLAHRGLRFTRAYCQYPLCGPSRASFMAGLYPDQTLIRQNAIHLRERLPDVKSMSQFFREQGYFATRVGKIYHYNVPKHIGTSGHDDPWSWDATFNPRGRDVEDEDEIFSLVPGNFGGTLSWLAAEGEDAEQTDAIGADIAIRELKRFAEKEQPFFLAVGLFRPHTPYVAPKKYFDLYPLEEIVVPKDPDGYLETLPEPARQSIRRKKDQVELPEALARQAIQAYYASITFADAQVGRILETLEASGLAENTIVLFTSDHGYHMGEHGHWQKTTLFENAARVPLIMAGPGVTAKGTSTEAFAEMVDFYPTLAELAGWQEEAPGYLQGVSLVPALSDPEASPRRDALTQYASGYSLRSGHFRYTEWGEQGEDGKELYDHRTDPAEMVNLADQSNQAETVTQLVDRLHERIRAARTKPDGVTQIVFENRRRVR